MRSRARLRCPHSAFTTPHRPVLHPSAARRRSPGSRRARSVVLDQLLPQVLADRLAEPFAAAALGGCKRRAERAGLLPVAGVPAREDAVEVAQHFFQLIRRPRCSGCAGSPGRSCASGVLAASAAGCPRPGSAPSPRRSASRAAAAPPVRRSGRPGRSRPARRPSGRPARRGPSARCCRSSGRAARPSHCGLWMCPSAT